MFFASLPDDKMVEVLLSIPNPDMRSEAWVTIAPIERQQWIKMCCDGLNAYAIRQHEHPQEVYLP